MTCPKCGSSCFADLEITGGCQGHTDGSYCYCPSKDVSITFNCSNDIIAKEKNKKKRNKLSYCNFKETPPGLTDKYAIERWFKENY